MHRKRSRSNTQQQWCRFQLFTSGLLQWRTFSYFVALLDRGIFTQEVSAWFISVLSVSAGRAFAGTRVNYDRILGAILGCPSILGIAEFIVPTGSFFHAQTHISFHVIEELSPNVGMILYHDSVYKSSVHKRH